MADAQVAEPGDANEPADKLAAADEAKAAEAKSKGRKVKPSGSDSDASVKEAVKESEARDEALKGPFSPAQHDDDGWGGLPVQMRGGDDEAPAQVEK